MFVMRPVEHGDLKTVLKFSEQQSGITTLQNNESLLHQRLLKSEHSFQKEVSQPEDEYYLFGLEELSKGRLIGLSALLARMGWKEPAYFYRTATERRCSEGSKTEQRLQVLLPVSVTRGPSEICTLFLTHRYRGAGVGRLLSLSRFLFVACFRSRFEDQIAAELRGVIGDHHFSPFYEAVGRHFFGVGFDQVVKQVSLGTKFIGEQLLPHAILVDLLPASAREVIGKSHPNTEPALRLLESEGFYFSGDVDCFDAGPKLIVNTDSIRAVKESAAGQAAITSTKIEKGTEYLICNGRVDWRACQATCTVNGQGDITLHRDTAKALKVKEGDTVRYVTLKPVVQTPTKTVKTEASQAR